MEQDARYPNGDEYAARELDSEAAANITKNFLPCQELFIKRQLEPLLAARPELNINGMAELICMKIDKLPLDGRDDFRGLATRIGSTNAAAMELETFVGTERARL